MRASVLSDIKVLDLSIWLPGPYCSMILGDLGAEIIKVERRLLGDPARHAYPFANDESCHFLTFNRNKKSLALNLKRDEGRQIFLELAAAADVVLESYKPGQAKKMGIGYEHVREVNPHIVYCSLSGYGQDGPHAQRAGHDINYSALGGLLDVLPPSKPPVLAGTQFADLSGGLFAVIGIVSALVQRQRSGTGTYIDVSMLDSLLSLVSPAATALLCDQPTSEGYNYLAGRLPCYNLYRTSDGRYMTLGALEPIFWSDFCKVVEREDLAGKQFPDADEREAVIAEVQALFSERTQAEWIELFSEENVCCEPVNSLEEALEDPQIQHRGMIFDTDHPRAGRVRQIGLPIHSGEKGIAPVSPAPLLGQHTLEIMQELGYEEQEIGRLREEKIIAAPDDTPPPSAFTRRGPAG